jgi:hypothetical protein
MRKCKKFFYWLYIKEEANQFFFLSDEKLGEGRRWDIEKGIKTYQLI